MGRRIQRSERGGSSFGRFLALIIALILLAASVLVMYPALLHSDKETGGEETSTKDGGLGGLIKKAENEVTTLADKGLDALYSEVDPSRLGFENYPLYGTLGAQNPEGFYGVKNVLEDCKPYITGEDKTAPKVGELLKKIPDSMGTTNFMQSIYNLVLIALISIPVYMILRLLVYTALYRWIDEGSFLLTLPLRGIATVACGVTSGCISWVVYNTVVFNRLLKKLINWLSGLSSSNIAGQVSSLAVNASNLFVIVIIIGVIWAMVKLTIFRGSVSISVFLGLFRSLLFLIVFAFINVFIGDFTWRVILFGLLFALAAGVVERLFDR